MKTIGPAFKISAHPVCPDRYIFPTLNIVTKHRPQKYEGVDIFLYAIAIEWWFFTASLVWFRTSDKEIARRTLNYPIFKVHRDRERCHFCRTWFDSPDKAAK